MTKKQQITYSIIAGTLFLCVLLGLAVFIECPTQAQGKIFSVVLALAAASYAASIPGFLNVKVDTGVTAGGALGVFVIVFFWSPADIQDFTRCSPAAFAGTLYFGNKPLDAAQIRVIRYNQVTETNSFGNFNFEVNVTSDVDLKIRVTKNDIDLDTVFVVKAGDLQPFNDLVVQKYCIECAHLRQDSLVVGVRTACAATMRYIRGFEDGFTRRGAEQGFETNCRITRSP